MTPSLRPLGATSLLVSPIGLGTVKLGRNEGVKYPDGFALPDDAHVDQLLKAAADLGVNLIDTAPAYGLSETRLGERLHRARWFGGRDRWVLCTKAGEEFSSAADSPTGEASSRFDFSPDAVRKSIHRSLQRLRTDHLDIVLLHSDGRDEWILRHSGGFDALLDLHRQGLVRAVGISTKSPAGTHAALDAIAASNVPGVVMVTLNAAERDELPAIARAHALGVGVLAKKALLSGHIDQIRRHAPAELAAANNDPVEAACRVVFAPAHPGVSSMIVGTLNPDHLAHAVQAQHRAVSSP